MQTEVTNKRKLKTFPGLKAEDFQHPLDRQATQALKAIPGFEFLATKLLEYGVEQQFRLINLASNLRVRGKMLPRLKEIIRYATRILDMPEPELYLTTNPMPNAFTYGQTNPFILLTSGLVEAMNEEEIFFVIAHELGHIKCGHVLYKTMASHFKLILDIASSATFGLSSLIGSGLEYALLDWSRKAELSADRAAMLCVQDQKIVNRTLMKTAGAAKSLYNDMDEDEFFRQIKAFENVSDESLLNKLFMVYTSANMTHPFIIMRAKMLDEWIQKGEYATLSGVEII